jgi:hypothetical protein
MEVLVVVLLMMRMAVMVQQDKVTRVATDIMLLHTQAQEAVVQVKQELLQMVLEQETEEMV